MSRPLISIVMCCHNRADMLPVTLQSVFEQRYEPVEILVLDDGSTDDTAEVLNRYGDTIRVHRQENQGITVARTNACRLASGEYIAFIDDDDLMPPDRLVTLFKALRDFPDAVFAVGDFEDIDDEGKPTGRRWLRASPDKPSTPVLLPNGHEAVLWPRVAATVHTSLFRRADGERIGWFDEAYRYASEDKDFFARLGLLGPIVYVPEVVSWYRRGHASLTRVKLNVSFEQLRLFTNHLRQIGDDRSAFARRLRARILTTLNGISRHRNEATKFSDDEIRDRIAAAVALLPLKDRIRYYGQSFIYHPLRNRFRERSR